MKDTSLSKFSTVLKKIRTRNYPQSLKVIWKSPRLIRTYNCHRSSSRAAAYYQPNTTLNSPSTMLRQTTKQNSLQSTGSFLPANALLVRNHCGHPASRQIPTARLLRSARSVALDMLRRSRFALTSWPVWSAMATQTAPVGMKAWAPERV